MFFPDRAPPLFEALDTLWRSRAEVVFIGSLLITLLATPLFRAIAVRLGIYDMPDKQLKPHSRPIPYLGGLAIYAGVVLSLLAAMKFGVVLQQRALWGILAGTTIITFAGLLDDLVSLKPRTKIIAQVAAALALAAGGIIYHGIPTGFEGHVWLPRTSPMITPIGLCVQILLVVAACNATNLLDGLDGLCSGVTAIIAGGFLLLATSIAAWTIWGSAPEYRYANLIVLVSMALLGATLGFLPYNFNPASIFMGDAGSMLMGFLCAALTCMFAERVGMIKWVIGALLIFGLPTLDTGLAFTRRWLNGKPIFQGDRSHLYDQLVDRGLSVRQTVAVCYTLALAFAALGVGVIFVRTRYAAALFVLLWTIIGLVAYKTGMLKVDRPAKPNATDQSEHQVGAKSG